MKKKITIIPFEEHNTCNVFSVLIDNGICEMSKFSTKLINDGKQSDLQKIALLLEKIGENGALERYLRYAGKPDDNVFELPDYYLLKSKYRLYCLRYSETLIILGNGGLKETRTYQEDPILNGYVIMLQKINLEIQKRIENGKIIIDGKTISGELEFFIK